VCSSWDSGMPDPVASQMAGWASVDTQNRPLMDT
jgi:hypothetical protein